jgi:Ca-activated chloride channel family protein
MSMIIRARSWGVLVAVLVLFASVSAVHAQSEPYRSDGWQGPKPTPQATTPFPTPQRPTPSGKQVLELPSQQQRSLELPRQQAGIPPRPQAEIPPRPQRETLRSPQSVAVTVTDQQGRYVSGLQREDFIVYEDGIPQEITYFNFGENEPVSLGLIVDTSGSMRGKIDHARQALRRFVDTIHREDEVFVEEFSSQPMLLQDFTDSRLLLGQAISLLRPVGGTALYDAVLDGLRRVKRGRHQKKALIVISDGLDTASLSSLGQVIGAAQRSGVLIYAIGIGNPNERGIGAGGVGIAIGPFIIGGGPTMLGSDEQIDTRTLQEICDQTGGRLFVLNTADVMGGATILDNATQTISRELRLQYSLGYTSSQAGNEYRKVRVETRRADAEQFVVRAQKGYAVD